MVKLGFNQVSIYPDTGIKWANNGTVVFNGNCDIGNDSAISVGNTGHLSFGENVRATAALKLVCYHHIEIGSHTLIGWENIISDTDFHSLYINGKKTRGYGQIIIGPHNWLAMQCLVLKGTHTPAYCVISARSLVNKDFSAEQERILLSGQPAEVKIKNIYHDRGDDKINYRSHDT